MKNVSAYIIIDPILETLEAGMMSMTSNYGFKYGNNWDNFAMLWNFDKIFGMLEDLSANNKATRHFLFLLKYPRYVCLKITKLQDYKITRLEMYIFLIQRIPQKWELVQVNILNHK